MTNKKITELTAHTAPVPSDLLAVVRNVSTTPETTKITLATALKMIPSYASAAGTVTATGAIALTDADASLQFIDPGGTARVVSLPTVSANNHPFFIVNTADVNGETLTVKDYALAVTVVEIEKGDARMVVSNGSTWYALTGGSSGAQTVVNNSGGTIAAGDVVIFDSSGDRYIKTSATPNDVRVMGVMSAQVVNGAQGKVYCQAGQIVTVNCTAAAVSRGQFLTTSSTAGVAQASGYFRVAGAFAIALTGKTGAGVGTVEAMLIDNFRQAVAGTSGWAIGGYIAAATTNAQKFTMANETWATVVAAALTTATQQIAGISDPNVAAYAIGGYTTGYVATAYKIPYSTETVGAASDANLGANTGYLKSGSSAADRGYVCGGNSGNPTNATNKILYSTSTRSAGNNLSGEREDQCGLSDGTYIYVLGGTYVNCDKITVATDAVAAHADGNLAAASGYYTSFSIPASAGYIHYKNGATSYYRKINFATGVAAAAPNPLPADHINAAGMTDGVTLGYAAGVGTSKFTVSTETWATTGVSMNVEKKGAAYMSYGTCG